MYDDCVALNKIKKYLSHSKNFDMLILKGHLILEDGLKNLITMSMKEPEAYFNNNPSFSQKLSLCKALWGSDYLWKIAYDFNKLRNKLVHNLEENREDLVYDFIKVFYKEHGDPHDYLIRKAMSKQELLKYMKSSIIYVIANLYGRAECLAVIKEIEKKKNTKEK